MLTLALALALASPATFDKAGRDAYAALRAFERVEQDAYHRPGHAWPTADQHREIVAACAVLAESVHDSLVLRYDLTKPEMGAQAHSMLLSQRSSLLKLEAHAASAPAAVQKQAAKVRRAFDKLYGLFPPVADDAHPPARGRQ